VNDAFQTIDGMKRAYDTTYESFYFMNLVFSVSLLYGSQRFMAKKPANQAVQPKSRNENLETCSNEDSMPTQSK